MFAEPIWLQLQHKHSIFLNTLLLLLWVKQRQKNTPGKVVNYVRNPTACSHPRLNRSPGRALNGLLRFVEWGMLGLTLLIMFMSVADMLASCCALGRWTAFTPAAAPGFYAPERCAAALCAGALSQHGHKASLKGLTMSPPVCMYVCVWGLLLPSSVALQTTHLSTSSHDRAHCRSFLNAKIC